MVALIYISLIAEDVEHLFTCLLFIQVVLAKCCSNFCLFFFFLLHNFQLDFLFSYCCKNYFHILDTSSSLVIFSSNLCLPSSVA